MRNFSELNYEFLRWKRTVNKKNRYFTRTGLLDLLYKHNPQAKEIVNETEKAVKKQLKNITSNN